MHYVHISCFLSLGFVPFFASAQALVLKDQKTFSEINSVSVEADLSRDAVLKVNGQFIASSGRAEGHFFRTCEKLALLVMNKPVGSGLKLVIGTDSKSIVTNVCLLEK